MKHILLALTFTSCILVGCASPQLASFNAKFASDVAKAQEWAQSPTGQTILNVVSTGVNAYVQASGGGPKSTANAQALSAAVRSLETGKAPDIASVANAVGNYVPSGTSKEVLAAIVASAATAPTPNGGLEVAAKAIDQAATSK